MGRWQKTVKVPELSKLMRDAEATNIALAAQSGVSDHVISGARQGKEIREDLAAILLQTLKERKFQYAKMGRPRSS
ncbi:hypothetical protein KI809_18835 [Geobacter pelophilus]|uniref:XRE family transcriptional regulator n=1 Tax=Geoanaerobacter pelophilus TaxID=60036 RepID=A0AAW4LED4_9BACT|nr:hypothetical protein [Geoanaerobacter pelophilus]MBT0666369.1 hypothetical protein [Geoanaerobacter pelophilus]